MAAVLLHFLPHLLRLKQIWKEQKDQWMKVLVCAPHLQRMDLMKDENNNNNNYKNIT